MKYKRTQKRSKQMWQRVEKFSIRKFSIGVASCLIGAQIAISGVTNIAKADGITAYKANGDKVTAYAHGESVYKLRGTSTSIYNAFLMDVDTSKYTKENPIIKVTLTYNAKDNQTGSAPIFWSGRPMHWFTVPEATEELGNDYKLTLTNGSGSTAEFSDWRSWESNSRFIHSKYKGNPDAWERYNTTTTEMLKKTPFASLNSEFNKVLGDNNNRWYDNSNMPTQDIMRDLRAKSNSIYIDWEKRAAGTVTVSYTTKVKDPEKTKELTIGMGIYQPSNAQQYARVETIKLPVLYKLNEVFEPKEPERTAVKNITNLDDDEIAIIREKIWAANLKNTSTLLSTNNAFKDNLKDSSNNGANSISIDKTTGTATITYKDNTKDTIEGSKLIYKKPGEPKPVTPPDGVGANGLVTKDGNSFYMDPLEVDDLNNISEPQRKKAKEKFMKANLTAAGLQEYDDRGGVSKNNLKPNVNFSKLPAGGRNRASIDFRGSDYYISLYNQANNTPIGVIHKEYLFKQKAKPAFDINAAKEEANKLIDSLDNLYPNEKLGYKAIIKNAPDRDSIEREVNQAKAKANENAVELAKMKKEANDKINGLNYLTQEERENAINKINSATIKQDDNNVDSAVTNDKGDKDTNRNDTRDRLNSVVNELVQQDLQKARQKAIETINSIPNEDLSSDKKTDYINKINAASKIGPASEDGTILNIVEKAQKEASQSEADRKKAEADKVRQQYKDMIANIPGLTNEEKTEYNNAIDAANNVDEMNAIVEFAKLAGERKNAKSEIDKLDYLNDNQRQSFINAINDSATKAELDYYVSQAIQLNSKMKQLHDLAAEARKIKPKSGAPQDKYTSAAADKQAAFDKALADAERVLDKATGADEAITSVGKLFTALETAINELKPGEKVTIPADKSALKAEYDKKDSVKESALYKNSTDEGGKTAQQRKDEYDRKLEAAKFVLEDSNADQTAVDKALDDLLSAKAGLNGKETEFTLSKKDESSVPISVEPTVGAVNLSPADKESVKDKIKGIPTGATVIYNPIVEKANKKYVPVKVIHENVSKEIEIEVVQSVASKVTPTADTAKLSETPVKDSKVTKAEDVQKVKEAVKVPEGTQVTDKKLLEEGKVVEGTDQSANGGANNVGKPVVKVEVTYGDGSKDVVEVPVRKETDADKATPKVKEEITSGEVPVSVDPTKATKVTEQKDKDAITDAVEVPKDQPQPTNKQVKNDGEIVGGTGANVGKKVVVVEVTYPDGSKDEIEVPVRKETDADKATPKVKEEITSGEVPVSVDPTKATKVTEQKDKDAITDAVEVPKDQPQPTNKQVKNDGEIVGGTGANVGKKVVVVEVTYPDGSKDEIEVPVRKATDKDKAKADLTKAADAEKAEIEEDNALSKKEKATKKDEVDKVKKAAEDEIDKAGTPAAIASATEKGRQEIAAVHTPQDIAETAKRRLNPPTEKVKVTDINHLTDKEKVAVKKAIVATNPSLEESEVYVSDKGDVASPKGFLEAAKVVVQALNKPATPVPVKDPNHLTPTEKDEVKEAVANANPGLNKDGIDVDDQGNVTTGSGKLLAKDVVTPTLKKPITPVEVKNPASLTEKEKEDIKDAVVAANPDLNKGNVTVDNQGNVETPKGNLPKEDVVTTVLNKPNKLVEVENPNSLTVKEKEAVKKAIVAANPGLTEDKVKVDDQGNVTTPQGNLPAKDVVTSTLKKPTNPVEVVNPSKLTEPEKSKIVEEIIKHNPGLTDKDIKVDDQGNVETPKGNLPAEDVVTPALKKPTNLVPVKDVNNLSEKEKDAVKDAIVAANPDLNKNDVKVDGQGNVKTPKGDLLAGEVVTPALKKPTTPVQVKNPASLTEKEKDAVKDAVVAANSGLNKGGIDVDDQGNVKTPNGNLPASDVVTPELNVPTKPIVVVNPESLTDKEKEDIKKAVIEANPGLDKKDITVDNQGNVETSIGNLPAGKIVKASKGEAAESPELPELDLQTVLVAGVVTVEKGQPLTDEDIKKQLVLTEDMVVNSIKKPSTTETGNKEAEVEITLADGSKVTVKVPVVVVESLENANTGNNLAEAKEEAKKHVEEAANKKIEEINNRTDLSDPEKKAATDKVNKAKDDANTQIDNATSSGTAKAIGDAAAENIQNFNPEANNPAGDIDQVDTSKLDEEKAKAIAEIEQAAKDQINAINNNKGLTSSQKAEAIKKIEELKAKAIEDVRKADSVDKVKDIVNKVVGEIKAVNPQPYSGYSYGDGIHSSSDAQANSEALANAKESAKNAIEKAAKDKQDEIKDASLSDKEQAELLARVEAEKQAALKAIENAKTVEDVKEAETIGLQAIASVTVPKKPVTPNAAAPQATSAPQATAGTMQDVTYQSPARKQLPNTGSASSAALASLGLVAATSGFALLGRKARRRK